MNTIETPKPKVTSQRRQAGFTIVELMVATLIFSFVLVIITIGVLYFSKSYYTGLNRSRTQNAARNIVGTISQAIQFTGTTIATTADTGAEYFCAGGRIYAFKSGVKYLGGVATATNPGLYSAPQSSGCAALAAGGYNNAQGQQLLSPGMRIAYLSVTKIGTQLYTINLTLLYGDDDLLSATTGAGAHCLSQTGSQYCASSVLTSTVEERLQGSQLSG
ncbi:MAG TPA: prepilin-type N-terminal cleavage/methylation domain-containing protein [Candidatus Saccharimonadales bacterium]|nr:prepilin-type N-terminal cleavage/methylation domain-containing protein [Candidatus Saccharimonadales bacterium]